MYFTQTTNTLLYKYFTQIQKAQQYLSCVNGIFKHQYEFETVTMAADRFKSYICQYFEENNTFLLYVVTMYYYTYWLLNTYKLSKRKKIIKQRRAICQC